MAIVCDPMTFYCGTATVVSPQGNITPGTVVQIKINLGMTVPLVIQGEWKLTSASVSYRSVQGVTWMGLKVGNSNTETRKALFESVSIASDEKSVDMVFSYVAQTGDVGNTLTVGKIYAASSGMILDCGYLNWDDGSSIDAETTVDFANDGDDFEPSPCSFSVVAGGSGDCPECEECEECPEQQPCSDCNFPVTLDLIAPEPVVQYYDDYRIRILAGDYCVEGALNGKVRLPYDLLVSIDNTPSAAYDTTEQGVIAPTVIQCLPDKTVVTFPNNDQRGCSMAVALGPDGTVYVVPYGFCGHRISGGDTKQIVAKNDPLASSWNDLESFDITTGVGFSPGKTNKITFQMAWGIDQNDLSYTDTVVVYTDDSDTTIREYLTGRQGVQKYDEGDGKYSYSWKQYNHRRYNMYHPDASDSDIETYNRIVSYTVFPVSGSDGYIPTGRVHNFKEKDSSYLDARILGGFHCLVQSVAANAPMLPISVFGGRLHPLAGHSAGSILPKSVWALNFSPSAPDPSAMAFIDFLDTWVDVYMDDADISWLSGDNAAIKDMDKLIVRMRPSVLSTAFNLSWFEMTTALANEGKRLLTHDEFYAAAIGSNVGTFRNPATVTFGGVNRNATDSAGNRMVSNVGCEDMCGLFFQPLGSFGAPRSVSSSYTSGQTTPSWCGRDALGKSIYLITLLAGGGYFPDTSVANRNQNTWQDCNAVNVGPLCRNGRNSQDGPVCNMAPRGCCGTAYSF